MANTDRLAEVTAKLAERDQEFAPIKQAANGFDDSTGEHFWPLSELQGVLQIDKPRKLQSALNRAKVAADRTGFVLADHFRDGTIFDQPNEVYLSKYACYLVVMNCDPSVGLVASAQAFFALQIDRQRLEDEKRIKTRLDVATETNKLNGVAQDRGVRDFRKFNGRGIQGLYGDRTAAQIKSMKGLPRKSNHLDYAGSEELAANLFRITQTRAALARQEKESEFQACETHYRIAGGVRSAILDAGNDPPEALPAASEKIDSLSSRIKKDVVPKAKLGSLKPAD